MSRFVEKKNLLCLLDFSNLVGEEFSILWTYEGIKTYHCKIFYYKITHIKYYLGIHIMLRGFFFSLLKMMFRYENAF